MQNRTGFTIVELLIVIVVIAILAVITIVAYNGLQNRSHNSSVQTDIKNISQQAKLYEVDNSGYPTYAQLATDPPPFIIKVNKQSYLTSSSTNAMLYCNNGSGEYAVFGKSKSGTTYYASSTTSGMRQYTGSFPNSLATVCGAVITQPVSPDTFTADGKSNWLNDSTGWRTFVRG